MADFALNKLEIIGNESQVNEVKSFLRGNPFKDGSEQCIDFNKIVPMPPEIEVEEIFGWRLDNWGVSWNVCDQWIELPNTIIFTTILSPVLELMKKLSVQFPSVEFIYGFDYPDVIESTWDSYSIKNGVEVLIGQYDGEDCPPIFSN